ncbi:MAG: response regulator [Deltaproteobacteria bacterium]|nr:response regulator [Deltaproteobacteria bacterium]
MAVDPRLQELRDVFVDEVAEQLEVLEQESVTLTREGTSDDERRAASAEIHRVVHSLKGAARAVAYNALERTLHQAEGALSPSRTGPAGIQRPGAPEQAAPVAAGIIEVLRRALAAIRAGQEPTAEVLRGAAPIAATPAAGPSSAPPAVARPAISDETIRVSSGRVAELVTSAEELMAVVAGARGEVRSERDLSGSLGDARGQIDRARALARRLSPRDVPQVTDLLALLDECGASLARVALHGRSLRDQREALVATIEPAVVDLTSRARALRLRRIGTLASVLERVAIEAAAALGRVVTFAFVGGDAELDRRVVDALREPLMHLVRNAVDHGIEPEDERVAAGKRARGAIAVEATVHGQEARIVVRDDGRGLDLDALQAAAERIGVEVGVATETALLAFEAGVTTRADATDLSGRGIGLDVVRHRVTALRGRVDVQSSPREGARFTLTVPVDANVLRAIVARTRDVAVAIPSGAVQRIVRLRPSELVSVEGRSYFADTAGLVPFADLGAALGFAETRESLPEVDERVVAVLVISGDARGLYRVHEVVEEREIVARPLGARVRRAAFVSAITVLENGEIALLLHPPDLVRWARPASSAADEGQGRRRARVLVVDDSVTTRQLERTILEGAGYEVVVTADGQQAWDLLEEDGPFDVVVSDLEMPRLDGFQLVRRIRASVKLARTPIVVVTALAREADRRRAIDLGADAYVVKGRFDQEELLDVIERLLT